jgi:cytochrome c biogenesis protein CcmG, thiol:disulfide interchange protein DsbE
MGAVLSALIVAAAVTGVATGSLSGPPTGKGAADQETVTGETARIAYAHPAPAPAVNLPALAPAGASVSLSQYPGKPVVLNFSASWCEPCQRETPLIASFYKAHHGAVTILGMDGNDTVPNATAFFFKKKGVTYRIAFDPHLALADAYNVTAFPQTFFLNAQHRVVYRVIGEVNKADMTHGVALMNR